jgi:DNA topoisomerase-1
LDTIKFLSKDAKSFTIACDYDIEGEVIGFNCIRFICGQKDANRMKFSTLTKSELVSSYENKSNTLNWGQANAGETRHLLDWMYGINMSRALCLAVQSNGKRRTLSTGRVQGPTLKLVVDREREIQSFKPKKYWQLELKGELNDEKLSATHEKERFSDEKEVDSIRDKTKGKNGLIKDVKKEEKIVIPPYAFDLTTLQIETYKTTGIGPKQALSAAQNLYLGGYISYPRTSSQKLPPTIGYKKIITALQSNDEYSEICIELLVKSLRPSQGSKQDPAHPAIYPTGRTPKSLKNNEKKVYDIIVRRFLSAFGESAKRIHTTLKIGVEKEPFKAIGKLTVEKGWYAYYKKYLRVRETELPKAKKGDEVKVEEILKHEKETEPPKRYNQATIIKELEKRNLGTKSTRAQIVDTLYRRGYIKGARLEATIMGIKVVDTLDEYSPKMVDEELTRNIEEDMQKIREEKKTKDLVIEENKTLLKNVLSNFKKHEKQIGKKLADAQAEVEKQESIGVCPICKEGKLLMKRGKFGRFIACDQYPECKQTYKIPKSGFIEPSGNKCSECKTSSIFIKFKGRKKQEVCINDKCPSKQNSVEQEEEKLCSKCKKGTLKLRTSMYGSFYGCSNYPKCKHTEKIVKKKV